MGNLLLLLMMPSLLFMSLLLLLILFVLLLAIIAKLLSRFGALVTASNSTELYVDLTAKGGRGWSDEEEEKEEEHEISINGFDSSNVYFVTGSLVDTTTTKAQNQAGEMLGELVPLKPVSDVGLQRRYCRRHCCCCSWCCAVVAVAAVADDLLAVVARVIASAVVVFVFNSH